MTLQHTVAQLVSSLNLTHEEFARRIGVSRTAVTCYVLGKRIPRPEIAVRIGKLTNTVPIVSVGGVVFVPRNPSSTSINV